VSEYKHIPVMPDEVIEYLAPGNGAFKMVDGTLGGAGHSSLILKLNGAAELLGIDHDSEAIRNAGKVLEFAGNRVKLVRGAFSTLAEQVIGTGWLPVDAVLLDLGISSPQIDTPGRGFSLRVDGPLDMRMDVTSSMTAARVLNNYSEDGLAKIFRDFGEIRESRKLAKAVIERREVKAWSRTGELVELCENVLKSGRRKSIPSATLCFQALRICVNDELEELKKGLRGAVEVLAPGGRVVVISFHSLEDRIVKNFFRKESAECLCPPGLPVCICEQVPSLKLITRKPVTASEDEIRRNRRSGSAKLRVAEKI
jgi:16S rRNA (cytosine1402-N4)-methyltransferase